MFSFATVMKKVKNIHKQLIYAALVQPQNNFLAIFESSGNIIRIKFVARSLARKAILCLATKIALRVSASMAL